MALDNENNTRIATLNSDANNSESLLAAERDAAVLAALNPPPPTQPAKAIPLRADWPRPQLPTLGRWAAAYAASFGFVGFFYRVWFAEGTPRWRSLIIAILLPPAAFGFNYAVRSAATVYRRCTQYGRLVNLIQRANGDLTQTNRQLVLTQSLVNYLLIGSRRIEISLVQRIGGDIFLTLKPRRSIKLQKGDIVQVVDFSDGKVMGTFEIRETAPKYLAKAGHLNPLWAGFIRDAGAESSAPGNCAAILIEKESIQDEQ